MPAPGFAFANPQLPDSIGRYQILGEIGNGGMGRVLLGFDPTLERKVAIKAVHTRGVDPRLREELENRLFREARAAASLKHDGIVRIYDVMRIDDVGYIVMEFVPGKTLETIAQPIRSADVAYVLRVLRECAAALDHAHVRNIVHRDIKPGNIMIEEDTGAVRITDFGIAKILGGEAHTEPGMVLGTFEYMAPEQLRGASVDGRADQFALAILAQRMLTGAPIYNAETLRRLSYQITNEPPPSAHGLNPELPQEVDAVLMKALAKEPADRYSTCSDFVAGLEAALASAPGPVSSAANDSYIVQTNPERPDPPFIASYQTPIKNEIDPAQPGAARRSKQIRVVAAAVLGASVLIAAVIIFTLDKRAPLPQIPIASSPAAPAGAPQLPRSLSLPSGDMVLVEGGEALLGPERQAVRIDSFYLDATEVTNEAYLAFCQATGRASPLRINEAPRGNPVVNVTFDNAQAFAQWAGKRLPTGAEWEKAARGSDGRTYPWGNDWKDGAANLLADSKANARMAPANSSPAGASVYGALNMVGNVWEWTGTPAAPDETAFPQLSRIFRNLQPPLSQTEPMYQVRGGSFLYRTAEHDRPSLVSDWLVMPARLSREDLGFRCVKNP